ncbi:MAG: DUF2786 domain-containing protein [Actinomycetota bacterium]|nr:DUF2786 domain-containing protein [Actinomycetota bacterium]
MSTENVIERVRKLLALAGSSNEHEAALAAEKAQELMLRHGLGLAQVAATKHETFGVGEARLTGVRVDPWRRRLSSSVARALAGDMYFAPQTRTTGEIVFMGPRDSVTAMVELYQYLEATLTLVSAAATANRRERRVHGRTYRNSWLLGAVSRIDARLQDRARKIERESESNSRTLVLVQSAVERYMEEKHPDLVSATYSPSINSRAFGAGRAAAATISLGDRQMTGRRALAAG